MKKLSLLFIVLLCVSLQESFAQFEGKIQIDNYTYESGQKKQDDDSFVMYITPDRMLLQGDQIYTVGNSLKAEGILVRQKEKDFVFLTDDKEAMTITQSGITSFMNMFGDDAKETADKTGANLKVEKTGENKQVNGYECEKFIITDKDMPEKRSEVWMTKALDINWGILAESWDNLKGFTGNDLPLNLILKDGYFPIQWKQYEDDKLNTMAEAKVTKTDLARSKVQIPSDVKVVSLQNYLFQQMRKQQ